MKASNFAPVYACMYPQLAEITRRHGYALAAHGSMARDFDLICIPWVESPSTPQQVVDVIVENFAVVSIGEPEVKQHGRIVFTLSLGFGECFLDFSFMPVKG